VETLLLEQGSFLSRLAQQVQISFVSVLMNILNVFYSMWENAAKKKNLATYTISTLAKELDSSKEIQSYLFPMSVQND